MRRILTLVGAALVLAGCGSASGPDASPPNSDAQAFSTYLSARFASEQHDVPEAAHYYAQSLKSDPGNADLLSGAFFYSASAGDMDMAAGYAGKLIQTIPEDNASRLVLAAEAFHRKDYAEARKQLAASSHDQFSVLSVLLFDGWAAAAMGNSADASADIKKLAAQSGWGGVAAFHAALIGEFLGQKDTDALYAKAILLNTGSARVVEAYGRYLERQGRTADALKLYDGVNNAIMASLAAEGRARIAKNQKPDPLIRSGEEGAAEGLFGIAAMLNDAQSADLSILYLRVVLYMRPDLALADILLAGRYETLQKYDDAVAIYAKVDKSSPYYRMAAVEAARGQARLDHNAAAITQLKALLATDTKDSDTWIALGDTYRSDSKFPEAVEAYDSAEKTLGTPAKKDWPLFYARAMAEEKAGNWNKAEADVNTGLKLSPDQPELLNYLAYSWVDQGRRLNDALAMLEKARALRPYDGYIADSVGWTYYHLGRYDEAAQTLEAAVLLVPGDATINDHLGDALWKAGRKMEARYQWDHALTFGPENDEKATLEQKLKSGLSG